mgnify:CR=1 FL=1
MSLEDGILASRRAAWGQSARRHARGASGPPIAAGPRRGRGGGILASRRSDLGGGSTRGPLGSHFIQENMLGVGESGDDDFALLFYRNG